MKKRYHLLCRQHDDLPIFMQDWYLDAVCGEGEWDVALAWNGAEIAGALPYFQKKKGPFSYLTMPPFVKHLGPYLVPEYRKLKYEHRFFGELIDQLPSFDSFKQYFNPYVTNWLPFYWRGFRQTTRYTYQLDLDDLDRIYGGLSRNIRRNIRKARESVQVLREGSLDDFYRVNCLSFERQGIKPPYSLGQLRRHDGALRERGARQLFFAVDDRGRKHAAAHLIWDSKRSYYHLSGDDPELRSSGAGILLIWEAILFTRETLGLRCFDFEGSMMPNVEAVRRQFGARQTPYFYVWKYNSKWLKWLDALRQP